MADLHSAYCVCSISVANGDVAECPLVDKCDINADKVLEGCFSHFFFTFLFFYLSVVKHANINTSANS